MNRSGQAFTLFVTDATHPNVRLAGLATGPVSSNNFVVIQNCSGCLAYNVEWILGQPVPWDSSEGYDVSNFGTWTIQNATARAGSYQGGISSFPDNELTMVDPGGSLMVQPSGLSGSGSGFTDNFVAGM